MTEEYMEKEKKRILEGLLELYEDEECEEKDYDDCWDRQIPQEVVLHLTGAGSEYPYNVVKVLEDEGLITSKSKTETISIEYFKITAKGIAQIKNT